MVQDNIAVRSVVVRQPGGSYRLNEAFALLRLSRSRGHALIASGEIRTVYPWKGSTPRITDQEIARLLGETPAA